MPNENELDPRLPRREENLGMPVAEAGRMADRKRPPFAVAMIPVFVALFFGLLGLVRVTQSPQFASYRTLDVLQFVISGACLGVGLVGSIMWLVRHRT